VELEGALGSVPGVNVPDSFAGDVKEAAVIDAFSHSRNGILLNENKGVHSTFLLPGDITDKAAEPVLTSRPCTVFVFPIQRALGEGKSHYDAARSAWPVTEEYRKLDAYAVGLKNGISVGAYKIGAWSPTDERFEFTKTDDAVDALIAELENKTWRQIVEPAMGYYQRGNYLSSNLTARGNTASFAATQIQPCGNAAKSAEGNWWDYAVNGPLTLTRE